MYAKLCSSLCVIFKRYIELPLECRTDSLLTICLDILSTSYRFDALSILVHIYVRVDVHIYARSLLAKLDLANRVDFVHELILLNVLDYF